MAELQCEILPKGLYELDKNAMAGILRAGDCPENWLVDVPEEGKPCFRRGFTSDIASVSVS